MREVLTWTRVRSQWMIPIPSFRTLAKVEENLKRKMGTYISHFRVAENLLSKLKYLDAERFLFGNLAPDSGIPNKDWSQFTPPRAITHFLYREKGDERIADMEFYRQYLMGIDKETDVGKYSFLIGYFIHLVCDNLWTLWIIEASTKFYGTMIQDRGREAWSLLRRDWHDLDRKFYRDHSDCKIWKMMKSLSTPPDYLEYLPFKAMRQQMDYIEKVYLHLENGSELDRKYTYLNEATMDRFVEESTQVILEILNQQEKSMRNTDKTALSLIRACRLLPFEYPISDIFSVTTWRIPYYNKLVINPLNTTFEV